MADTAKQYDWTETGGFHPQLIRSLVTGAIVTPIVLAIPVAGIVARLTGSISIPIVVGILVLVAVIIYIFIFVAMIIPVFIFMAVLVFCIGKQLNGIRTKISHKQNDY